MTGSAGGCEQLRKPLHLLRTLRARVAPQGLFVGNEGTGQNLAMLYSLMALFSCRYDCPRAREIRTSRERASKVANNAATYFSATS